MTDSDHPAQYGTPSWAKVCENHPSEPRLGYLLACYDAAERLKRHERQLRCGKCGLWIWEEYLVNRDGAMTQVQFNRSRKLPETRA